MAAGRRSVFATDDRPEAHAVANAVWNLRLRGHQATVEEHGESYLVVVTRVSGGTLSSAVLRRLEAFEAGINAGILLGRRKVRAELGI